MPNTTAVRTAQVGAAPLFAGKNKIINGDFRINQRAFTSNTATSAYNFDRFAQLNSGGTVTVTPQVFTLGTAPVTGYEGTNFVRIVSASQSTSTNYAGLVQRIESVRTFAGQTITASFWAKADTGTPNIGITFEQSFGTGGSPSAIVKTAITAQAISTSWVRYSFTTTLPSIAGKTIGTTFDGSLNLIIFTSCGTGVTGYSTDVGLQNITADIWGVQLEAGSTATAFQTATGTIQGELAACQRYYYRTSGTQAYSYITPVGTAFNSSGVITSILVPVTMRVKPTSVDYSTLAVIADDTNVTAVTNVALNANATNSAVMVTFTTAGGLTQYRPYWVSHNNSTTAYIGVSAEL